MNAPIIKIDAAEIIDVEIFLEILDDIFPEQIEIELEKGLDIDEILDRR